MGRRENISLFDYYNLYGSKLIDDKHLTIEDVEEAVCSVKGSIGVGAHLALDALVAAHVAVDPPPLADVERDGHHDHA